MTGRRVRVGIGVLLASTAITCGGPKGGGGKTPAGGGSGSAVTGDSGNTGAGTGAGSSAGTGAGSDSTPTGPVRPANAVDVSLADVGLESSSLDRTADPCVDFYQFACGGWLAKNPIPGDRARWGRGAELDERNDATLRAILDEASAGKLEHPLAARLGDFYASCMDEAGIEAKGTAGIKPLLTAIDKIKDAKTWFAALVELHKVAIPVVFEIGADADLKDSTRYAMYLDSGGLGLPDRDYYFKDDFKDKLAPYKAHVGKMLGLIGVPADRTTAAADDVFAIETELARLTKTAKERRDLPKLCNPYDKKALKKLAASIDWAKYWKAVGVDPGKKIIVTTPPYIKAIDSLRKKFKPAQWQAYFRYHVALELAFALGKTFDAEAFELEKLTSGVETQRERAKRCVEAVGDAMPESLGQPFVDRAFPGVSKTAADQMVDAIIASIGDDIDNLSWMSDETKKMARVKLGKLAKMTGYPDTWKTYDFAIKRDDFAGNELRAAAFDAKRDRSRAGKPFDRAEWLMPAYIVNAYYSASANNTALPAGILQPPMYGAQRKVAPNLGAIGMVIGHELTHGFDDRGALFDAEGNLKNWWTDDDKKKFEARGKCVAEQYSTFEVLPRMFVDGQLTLSENIADLGGIKMAFRAYRGMRKDAAQVYIADGFTEDQQFFIAAAQMWCTKDRKDETMRRLTNDSHSPPRFRVYGALRNLPDFAKAFACTAGTPMAPANRCEVW
jgi:putative endopeptidase